MKQLIAAFTLILSTLSSLACHIDMISVNCNGTVTAAVKGASGQGGFVLVNGDTIPTANTDTVSFAVTPGTTQVIFLSGSKSDQATIHFGSGLEANMCPCDTTKLMEKRYMPNAPLGSTFRGLFYSIVDTLVITEDGTLALKVWDMYRHRQVRDKSQYEAILISTPDTSFITEDLEWGMYAQLDLIHLNVEAGDTVFIEAFSGSVNLTVYFCPAPPTIVPVTWSGFEAQADGNDVTLKAFTASEQNTHYMAFERSLDAKSWIAFDSLDAAGNTTVTQTYRVVDSSLSTGRYYYRVKQVDIDGKFSYSSTLSVTIEYQSLVTVLGNGSVHRPTIIIDNQPLSEAMVIDLSGKHVGNTNTNGQVPSLPTGSYFVLSSSGATKFFIR